MQARLEHHRDAGPAAAGHPDNVAGAEPGKRPGGLGPPRRGAGPRGCRLPVGELAPDLGVLREVAVLTGHRLGQLAHRLAVLADLPGQPDDAPVRLELGERRLEQRGCAGPAGPAGQVDRHVVRRAEAGVQRVGAGAGQAAERDRVHARLPQHDRVPLHVDTATACPAGELGVLPRGQPGVGLAVPLVQLLDDHGPGRHVDAEGQRLGGENRPDQAAPRTAPRRPP